MESTNFKIGMLWDEVAEWLRRWTANPLCSARVGSNPILVEVKFCLKFQEINKFIYGNEIV